MQFCDVKEAFGKGKGDNYNWDKIANISTQGGTLVETSTMPEREFTIGKGTCTVTEYGNAIPYTGKLEALSQFTITNPIYRALRDDQVKVLDKAVEAQFDACKLRAVSTATNVLAWTSNAAATSTAASNLNGTLVKDIVDYMLALDIPTFDGEDYACIASIKAARGIHDALEEVWKYTKYPLNGEIGRYYKARFARDTNALDNTIGTSNVTGEAYFFGAETVAEAVAIPEELRRKVPTDYDRSLGVAWYALLGFKIMWEGDPDYRIVKWDSA